FRGRHDAADDAAHHREELDVAGRQHPQDCRIAALRLFVLGEDLRVDASAGLVAYRRPHLDKPMVKGTACRLIVVLNECVLGRSQRASKNSHRSSRGAGDKRAASHAGRLRCSDSLCQTLSTMPAYWVARANVSDPATYKKYTDRVPDIVARHG